MPLHILQQTWYQQVDIRICFHDLRQLFEHKPASRLILTDLMRVDEIDKFVATYCQVAKII